MVKEAIQSHTCPSCGAAAFAGDEKFQHSVSIGGGGGGLVYELSGRCGACGDMLSCLDMR